MYNSNIDNSKTKEVDIADEQISKNSKKSVVAGEEVILNDDIKDDINNKNTMDEKTKKLLDKKLLIGIICILAIICCVVIYTVLLSSSNKTESNSSLKDESDLLVVDGEKYEGLNYVMTEENITQLGFFYDYSNDLEGNKIDVSYIKIDGLKDETLEEKINAKLKEEAESLFDSKNVQDSNILYDHIYNYTDVYVFNNVLSTMYCEKKCDIEGNVQYTYKSVNIELKDFKEFSLSDVFINSANLDEIFSNQTNTAYNENIIFSVSPKNIYYVGDDGKVGTISLYENKDLVAIYKRYSDGKKLFSKTYNATPYAFTTKKFIESDVYGLEEDNLFIDTCDLLIDTDYNENIINAANSLYKEALNKARNLSYSNPSKRYLVQIIPSVDKENEKAYNIKVEYKVYEISKQFFNDNIKNFIVASENKTEKENEIINYFQNPVMNAQDYLENTSKETLTKTVDENGNEVLDDTSDNLNNGIS